MEGQTQQTPFVIVCIQVGNHFAGHIDKGRFRSIRLDDPDLPRLVGDKKTFAAIRRLGKRYRRDQAVGDLLQIGGSVTRWRIVVVFFATQQNEDEKYDRYSRETLHNSLIFCNEGIGCRISACWMEV